MPPRCRAWPVVALLVFATPGVARADWLVTPFLGIWFGGRTALVDLDSASGNGATQTGVGLSASLGGDGPLGVEADTSFIPGFFERGSQSLVTSSRVLTLTGSLVLSLPRSVTRESLRPYLVVGGGLMNAHLDDAIGALNVRTTMPAFSIGGGAVGMLTAKTGVRFDLRYVRSIGAGTDLLLIDDVRLKFWRGSIGYVRRF